MNTNNRILILGAGVIGSLYALQFRKYGNDVTLLARGKRAEDLQQNGLRYDEKGTIKSIDINVITKLEDNDVYDVIFVAVRYDQCMEALEVLRNNKSKVIVTLTNTVSYDEWLSIVGTRLVPGFPGGGGDLKEGILYGQFVSAVQSTLIGEIDGTTSTRVLEVKELLESAKIKVEVHKNIYAFHISHAAFVAANTNYYTIDGMVDIKTAKSNLILNRVAKDIKHNIALLKQKQIPIADPKTKILGSLPPSFIKNVFRLMLTMEISRDALLGDHAFAARKECFGLKEAFDQLESK